MLCTWGVLLSLATSMLLLQTQPTPTQPTPTQPTPTQPTLTPRDVDLASRLELAVRYRELEDERPNLVLPVVLCAVGSVLFTSSSLYLLGESNRDNLFKAGSPLGQALLLLAGAGAVMMPIGSYGLWRGWQERKRVNAELRLIEGEVVRRDRAEAAEAGVDADEVERQTREALPVGGEYSLGAGFGGEWLTVLMFGAATAPLALLAATGGSFSLNGWGNAQTQTALSIAAGGVAAVGLLTLPLMAWTLHRNAGGHGSLPGAYLGFLGGALAAGALIALAVPFARLRSDGRGPEPEQIARWSGLVGLPILAAGALFAGPLVGLHLSQRQAMPSFAIAPTNGGAAVSLGWTF